MKTTTTTTVFLGIMATTLAVATAVVPSAFALALTPNGQSNLGEVFTPIGSGNNNGLNLGIASQDTNQGASATTTQDQQVEQNAANINFNDQNDQVSQTAVCAVFNDCSSSGPSAGFIM